MLPDTDTTVLGAGPYGLSLAAHLKALRVPFQLFGNPLASWRRFMPDGMILKSEPFASNLWDPKRRYTMRRYFESQGLRFQPVGAPVSLARFLEYADWFRNRAGTEAQDLTATHIRHASGRFVVGFADGQQLSTRRLVLATGHMAYRVIPLELQPLSEPQVLHSACIGELARYAGREVLIIGAGQSALETAALLHEAGSHVRLIVRRSNLEWNGLSKPRGLLSRIVRPDAGIGTGWRSMAVSELPRVFRSCLAPESRHRILVGRYGPSGAWWLRSRVEGQIEVMQNVRIAAAVSDNDGVRLSLSTSGGLCELHADHIVAATGYRVDVDRLELLDSALRAHVARESAGYPALDRHFESSVRGLFMVGIASAPVFGPIMRFMYGAKHAAPVVAARLRSTARIPRTQRLAREALPV